MEQRREVFCVNYSQCLMKAVRNGKRRFDCGRCKRFKPEVLDPEIFAREGSRAADLIVEVFRWKGRRRSGLRDGLLHHLERWAEPDPAVVIGRHGRDARLF
jgi:hypothetical protein